MNQNEKLDQILSALSALTAENQALRAELETVKKGKPVGFVRPVKDEPVVSDDLRKKVIAAARNDTTKDAKGHYGSYTGHFIIASGLKKYGDKADFKANTILAAAREYGLLK